MLYEDEYCFTAENKLESAQSAVFEKKVIVHLAIAIRERHSRFASSNSSAVSLSNSCPTPAVIVMQ